MSNDQSAVTNPISGNVFLNINQFKQEKILEDVHNHQNSKYSFIVAKTIMHELFGHKKSSYSKPGINENSIISFNDQYGELNFISGNGSDLFIDTYKITSEMIDSYRGESGYFFEYFLGKIDNEYVFCLIDNIETKFTLFYFRNILKFLLF